MRAPRIRLEGAVAPGQPSLVLASASPRRRALLTALSVPFEVRPATIDEAPLPGERPRPYVRRVATAKAQQVARAGEVVIGADTVVVLGDEVLGKPRHLDEARRMLTRLSGTAHRVLTGVAAYRHDDHRLAVAVASTRVRFAPLGDEEIDWYLATGESLDKAGAYAVQGAGAWLIETVHGSYSNVVGLPLTLTVRLCTELGVRLFGHPPGGARHLP